MLTDVSVCKLRVYIVYMVGISKERGDLSKQEDFGMPQFNNPRKHWLKKANNGGGENMLMAAGLVVLMTMLSAMGIDVGMYFNTQNQLQTVVNHAALAGASKLPYGETVAESRARALAEKNVVLGEVLPVEKVMVDSTPLSIEVTGQTTYHPLVMKAFCNSGFFEGKLDAEGNPLSSGEACGVMDVLASAKAVPAARDTVLVIDTSGSMNSLGNNRPMKDVKDAATLFVNMVSQQATQGSDRIALVNFNRAGTLNIGLTSQQQSTGYGSVKAKINELSPWTGGGINTNYYAGLIKALDELETNGRPNAQKRIIFMTDGKPNLPAPDAFNKYSSSYPLGKCVDPVNNSQPVKNLCVKNSKGQWVCPVLPNSQIKDSMISATAVSCGNEYRAFMQDMTNAQADRAARLKVVIDTIEISDGGLDGTTDILRRLTKEPNWLPNQLAYMKDTTKGQMYEARNYDATAISAIYAEAAKQIRVKLAAQ
jgi:Flp pilus assembly protein TadG